MRYCQMTKKYINDNRITYNIEITHNYVYYDKIYSSSYNRRCIDGKITGCGNCVGYCTYIEHSGFLTKQQRQEHNCIKKNCFYYLPKPKKTGQ